MYHSFRAFLLGDDTIFGDKVKPVSEVKELRENSAVLANGEELFIDSVILCTGYKYDFPFLPENCQPMTADDTKIQRLSRLYKMTVHVDEPNLYFIGHLKTAPAFLVFELQAQFVAAILARQCKLPGRESMLEDIEEDFRFKRVELGYTLTQIPYCVPLIVVMKRFQDSLVELAGAGWIRPIPDKYWRCFDNCLLAMFANPHGYRKRLYPLDTDWENIPRAKLGP